MTAQYEEFLKTLSQGGINTPPPTLQQSIADTAANVAIQNAGAAGYRTLNQNQFDANRAQRRRFMRHGIKDDRRNRQYGAFGAALNTAANLFAAPSPGQVAAPGAGVASSGGYGGWGGAGSIPYTGLDVGM